MSQLDIINAKKALRARLVHWEVPEPASKAEGFIDDLVAQGWIMQPQREQRPQPPRREEACTTCGRHLNSCICGEAARRAPRPASQTAMATALEEARAHIKTTLGQLDGTESTAVSQMAGIGADELEDLGGLPQQHPTNEEAS